VGMVLASNSSGSRTSMRRRESDGVSRMARTCVVSIMEGAEIGIGKRHTSSNSSCLTFEESVEFQRRWPKLGCDWTRMGMGCKRALPPMRSMPRVTSSKCLAHALGDCDCSSTFSRREAWSWSCDVRRPRMDVHVRRSAVGKLGLDAMVARLCGSRVQPMS
jgi:hypothetical protein